MLRNPFRRKPKVIPLYGWNLTKTTAYVSAKVFDDLFKGKLVGYDEDEGVMFASIQIGEQHIIVMRGE